MRRLVCVFCRVSRSQVTFQDLRGPSGTLARRRLLDNPGPRGEARPFLRDCGFISFAWSFFFFFLKSTVCSNPLLLSGSLGDGRGFRFRGRKGRAARTETVLDEYIRSTAAAPGKQGRKSRLGTASLDAKSSGCRSSSASHQGLGSVPA